LKSGHSSYRYKTELEQEQARMASHGFSWLLMPSHGFSWLLMLSHGIYRYSTFMVTTYNLLTSRGQILYILYFLRHQDDSFDCPGLVLPLSIDFERGSGGPALCLPSKSGGGVMSRVKQSWR